MEDMRTESPKPKTSVIVIAVIASAVIFGGLGYYIGQMYETAPAGTVTYASPSTSASTASSTSGSSQFVVDGEHDVGSFSFNLPNDFIVTTHGSCEGLCTNSYSLNKKESTNRYSATGVTITTRKETGSVKLEDHLAGTVKGLTLEEVEHIVVADVAAVFYESNGLTGTRSYLFVKGDVTYTVEVPDAFWGKFEKDFIDSIKLIN